MRCPIFANVKILKQTWSAIYHVWYYVVVFAAILLVLPFILIATANDNRYTNFFWWARIWAYIVLIGMGNFWVVKRKAEVDPNKTYIIIANHASELDIMLTLVLVKNCFVFIGKKELANTPLFGYFYRRTNILVDRSSIASKRNVLKQAAKRIADGIGICIFPEGGILDAKYMLAPFKAGAFKLAIEEQIDILPITYPDNRRHFDEFWDGGYPGRLRATVHQPISTAGLTADDIGTLAADCYKLIHDELRDYGCTGETIYAEEKTSFAAS